MIKETFWRLLVRLVLKHAREQVGLELRRLDLENAPTRAYEMIYTSNSKHRLTITPDRITVKVNPEGMTELELYHMQQWVKWIATQIKPAHRHLRLSGACLKGKFCLQDADKTVTLWFPRKEYEATLPPENP